MLGSIRKCCPHDFLGRGGGAGSRIDIRRSMTFGEWFPAQRNTMTFGEWFPAQRNTGSGLAAGSESGHLGGQFQRLLKAPGVGDPFPRDVVSGSVVDRGPNKGEADRHIHRLAEGEELDRDEGLIMIKGHRRVETAFFQLMKKG